MAEFPLYLTGDGRTVSLEWTRLKPSSEVQISKPEPRERSTLGRIGPIPTELPRSQERVVGVGFDRQRFSLLLSADRSRVLDKLEIEGPWQPEDFGRIAKGVVDILGAHDYPVKNG